MHRTAVILIKESRFANVVQFSRLRFGVARLEVNILGTSRRKSRLKDVFQTQEACHEETLHLQAADDFYYYYIHRVIPPKSSGAQK